MSESKDAVALLSFAKLVLLLTPVTYIHVGDAEIDYFGPKLIAHDFCRGSLNRVFLCYKGNCP
jgi:hypothetical protein